MSLRVVITTCARPGGVNYLPQTLRSLPCVPAISRDDDRRGARWNMWQALSLALACDRILVLQDDVEALPGLLEMAESMDVPNDVGFVTFHDFGDDFDWETPPAGVHKFPAHRFGSIGLCGAQALLFPVEHAAWLAEQDAGACPRPGPHGADYAVGWHTARSPRPNKLIVSPAMVRHIGERSACHDEARRAAGASAPHAGRTISELT